MQAKRRAKFGSSRRLFRMLLLIYRLDVGFEELEQCVLLLLVVK